MAIYMMFLKNKALVMAVFFIIKCLMYFTISFIKFHFFKLKPYEKEHINTFLTLSKI